MTCDQLQPTQSTQQGSKEKIHCNCKFGLGPGVVPCTRAAGSTPTPPTPQQPRVSTCQRQRRVCMLCLGREMRPQRPTRVPKEARHLPGVAPLPRGEPGAEVPATQFTVWHHGHANLLVLPRKGKFCAFMNKIAQIKAVSTPHPQLKYPAQQLFKSPSTRRGWWYSHSSQRC